MYSGKGFWTSDKLMSLCAILVSLMTLCVFIFQTNLIRKQQFMSVYPHLSLGNQRGGSLDYSYILKNEGVGPAFIKAIEIKAPDGEVFHDLVDYVDDTNLLEDSVWYFHSNLVIGQLIPSQKEIPLIQAADASTVIEMGLPPNTLEGMRKLYEVLNHDSLSMKITYESIYGESWTVDSRTSIPVKN